MKYIEKLGRKEIYDYSSTKGFVELWDLSRSNMNREARKETITTIASLSYGNEQAKNPHKLYKLLEDLGHESIKEFIRFPDGNDCIGYGEYKIIDSLRNNSLPTYEAHADNEEDIQLFINTHKKTLATFKIKVPIFVRSQYHRHRCQSILEMSRRYVKPDKVDFEFWCIDNPYNISVEIDKENFTVDVVDNRILLGEVLELCVASYFELLKRGHKPEVARSVLPQSLYTIFWVMKDFECAINFYVERYSIHAQEQIREVAEAELKLLYEYQPEFLGQYVTIVGDEKVGLYNNPFELRILEIQNIIKIHKSSGMDRDIKILYCDYGNEKYFAKFDVDKGLFVGKILKELVTGV